MRVVLAGGGTAGHTSPLIATAEALRAADPSVDLLCVGTVKGLESRVIPAAGLRLDFVDPVPLPRKLSWPLATLPWRLGRAVRQARRILAAHHADVAVGFGGYASLPVYLAARTKRIPVVVHEQNAIPGLANRIAARFAARVVVSFDHTGLPHEEHLGLPVRAALTSAPTPRPTARAAFGLPATGPVLLVSGGSQGARSLNEATLDASARLLGAGVSVLHVWGRKNFPADAETVTDDVTGAVYRPVAYVDRIQDAYAAADLMLGRSGAGTVVETAVVGLPGIFVPLPHGNGEQARNAADLVAADAAILVPDAELDADRLLAEALPLLGDPGRLAAMAEAAHRLVPADAARRLAAVIADTARRP